MGLMGFGERVRRKREKRGLRATAKEIGVSPATLSRIERGHPPDLANFAKLCRWLGESPAELLGLHRRPVVSVHFSPERMMQPETARALAEMILAAERALA